MRFILFIFLFLNFTSLLYSNDNVFLFYNTDFQIILDNYKKTYDVFEKNMYRNFYTVKKSKIVNFSTFKMELDRVIAQNKSGIIILDDFLSPLLLKDDNILNNKDFKLITYNLPEDYKFDIHLPVFNIIFDKKILNEEIIRLLKNKSKNKDLSDCAILINKNHDLCNGLLEFPGINKYKIIIKDATSSIDIVKKIIDENKISVLVLFGFSYNSIILESEKLKDIDLIEILTDYGKMSKKVKYRIDLKWDYAINEALHSNEFKSFVKDKKKSNKIINYIAKNKSIIYTEKNNKNIINFDNTSDNILDFFKKKAK